MEREDEMILVTVGSEAAVETVAPYCYLYFGISKNHHVRWIFWDMTIRLIQAWEKSARLLTSVGSHSSSS